ncbi:helix-turn-helix domain-containing protein [Mucilaginibacter xinganensis]|uniref:HTH domain-containing protein n=1 Tax=Mucilaginibacter xinganensis TaxID=1234841 RepID=A0A223NYW1_9SPHI|nr:HTH domain-containing protein [Mucilaginibacter xinganensis]ASU34761.1 HTH domain-containing protein [Mucilaginibacter xinganensis]
MGEILERVVRRDRMSISELSRNLDVSRRTIYNWFEMERLSVEIIKRIGFVIGHDFSKEFPEEFAINSVTVNPEHRRIEPHLADPPPNAVYYWMDRYIKLLEKYTEVLNHGNTGLLIILFFRLDTSFSTIFFV